MAGPGRYAQAQARAAWIAENPELAAQLGMTAAGARQLTAADVAHMSGAELSKAAKAGLLADYFASPNVSPLAEGA